MSPTQRTLAELRKRGYIAHIVEKWNPFAKIRQDFGGFADILAYKPEIPGVLAIQTTSDSNIANRVAKSSQNSNLRAWLASGASFEVWGWGRKGKRGKRKIWTLRSVSIKRLDQWGNERWGAE